MASSTARVEPTARELLALALEFHRAALALEGQARKGETLSRAPKGLLAVHAIELYLSALLIHLGMSPHDIRKLGHDLSERVARAEAMGLRLRQRTRDHLVALSDTQAYVVLRYRPAEIQPTSPNRLDATLREVALKTADLLARAQASRVA